MNTTEINVHQVLIENLEAVRNEYLQLGDKREREALLLQTLKNATGDMNEMVGSNLLNIITHYTTANNLNLDQLVHFLSAIMDNPVDNIVQLRELQDDFDSKFNTSTSTVMYQYELPEKVSAERHKNATRYVPSPVEAVHIAMRALPEYNVHYDDFVFIDIGSGMGRNLLLASHYPFRKIMGVEISSHLHNIAEQNIARYKMSEQQCDQFELQCVNALDFSFPETDMVLYFYEPFSAVIADSFFRKLEHFLENRKHKVVLIFLPIVYAVVKQSSVFSFRSNLATPEMAGTSKGYFTYSVYTNF